MSEPLWALLSARQQGQQLKIPAALSAAMGVLRGKTKPFPTLIISMVMRQSHNSWVHDVTLQDCGPVASNTLFWSEMGEQLILPRNVLRESLQMGRYQRPLRDGRKWLLKTVHSQWAYEIRVAVFIDWLQAAGRKKRWLFMEVTHFSVAVLCKRISKTYHVRIVYKFNNFRIKWDTYCQGSWV